MSSQTPSLQDRRDLEDGLLAYLTAVDKLDDLDGMVACFTPDAVLDLTGLNLGAFTGSAEIRDFYAGVFRTMSHHMHMMTNFRVLAFDGRTAHCMAYVCGMGRSRGGVDIQVYVYYDLKMEKIDAAWRIAHFYEAPQLPAPPSVTDVHLGERGAAA